MLSFIDFAHAFLFSLFPVVFVSLHAFACTVCPFGIVRVVQVVFVCMSLLAFAWQYLVYRTFGHPLLIPLVIFP